MGRLNIEIEEDLHEALKEERSETGIPVKNLVNEALEIIYETSEENS